MRLATSLSLLVFSLAGVAHAAERTLSIEAELHDPKDKSLVKTQLLAAARSSDRGRGVFGDTTLIFDVDVGPTFDKDCNLVTVTGRLEEAVPEGKPKKRELKRTTVHACGASTQATIPGTGVNRLVVTVRPAP
jgi:serine protease inhibitor ecotin